ncbi:MAG: hypothetical protein IPL59_08435 [Candidatus Competibacteraceae bacterium]|nr:hypothetical protein [Candidatus Competibacteraceae bacterium]
MKRWLDRLPSLSPPAALLGASAPQGRELAQSCDPGRPVTLWSAGLKPPGKPGWRRSPPETAAVDLPTQHAALAGYAPPARTLKAAITAKPTPWRWSCSTIGLPSSRCQSHPGLPLTNSDAGALRHWVILPSSPAGTRTPVGSRVRRVTRQRHRYLPPAWPQSLALSGPHILRPPRWTPPPRPAAPGSE